MALRAVSLGIPDDLDRKGGLLESILLARNPQQSLPTSPDDKIDPPILVSETCAHFRLGAQGKLITDLSLDTRDSTKSPILS